MLGGIYVFIKKILGICTAAVMLFSASVSVCAVDVSANVPEEISEFADIVGLTGLSAPRPIYSPDEKLFGYCAEGTNCYIIYDTEYNMVEYSDSKLSEYHNLTSTLYYCGPLAYYVKENGNFENLQSGELYTANDFCSSDELKNHIEANAIAVESDPDFGIQPMATVTENYTIPDADFSYYDPSWNSDAKYGGSCGQLAATAILAFLAAEGSINIPIFYVQNPYYLFLELIQIIPHASDSYGTSPTQIFSGLKKYSQNKNYSYSVSYGLFSTTAENMYRSKVRSGIPSMVQIINHPLYKEHWVIGYGYRTVQGNAGTSKSVIVDDGWGNEKIYISDLYINSFVYFSY